MTALLSIAAPATPAVQPWRAPLLSLAAAAAAILILFAADAADMVRIWWTSATFNHCLLIPFLIAWLVRQRLPELRRLSPHAWGGGLVLVGAGAAAWLLGEAGSLALFRHVGVVLMLQGSVIACLGKAVSRGLAFPIFYALFLIPAGEQLVPPLQTLTAKMSMALLDLTAVPAHIEGIFISTPSGLFRVAEACSGVRFLVAMAAYGALVANVCFTAWPRRVAFMAAAVIVPILANGVRAWGTIYVAHLTNNEVAVGVDHLVYGWVFFAIVIGLIMAAAWRFFDRRPNDPWFDPERLQPRAGAERSGASSVRIAAAAVALAALAPLWTGAVAAAGRAAPPNDLSLPEVAGWARVSAPPATRWAPHFAGADLIRVARYRNAAGQEVDLALVWFARQEEGRELIGYGQGAADPQGPWSWTADLPAPPNGRAERIAMQGRARDVLAFYRVGELTTGSAAAVKLETMRIRLLGGPQRAAALLVSAEAPAEGVSARPLVEAFLRDLGAIEPVLERAAAGAR